MKISVIMPVFMEDEFVLRRSINSILAQTFMDFEFIIVLDNPENNVARNIISEYAASDSRIVFMENEKNYGVSFSRNRGLEIAKGEYIAFQDADDESMPERFEKQMNYFVNNPGEYVLGTSKIEYFLDKKIEIEMTEKANLLIQRQCSLIIGSTVIKKSLFDLYGKFIESSAVTACEDYDLFLRFHSKGVNLINLKEFLYKYFLTENSITSRKLKKQLFNHNIIKIRYIFKVKYNVWDYIIIIKDIFSLIIPNKLLLKLIMFNKSRGIKFYDPFNKFN